MKKKKDEVTIRSSAAEYLTYAASILVGEIMAKITRDMIPYAYDIAKRVYEGSVQFQNMLCFR